MDELKEEFRGLPCSENNDDAEGQENDDILFFVVVNFILLVC